MRKRRKEDDHNEHCYDYPMPSITVDCVIICQGQVLLIKRRDNPFKGCWALPGGFMNINETSWEAVEREVKEETGIELTAPATLRQVGVYDTVDRDERGRVVSIAFSTIIGIGKLVTLKAGDDATEVNFFDLNELPALAFDHARIIQDAVNQRKAK